MMKPYKGYIAEVEVDDEANVIFGTLAGIRAVITFEGSTVEEARQAFCDSVDDYLAQCAEEGVEPERPFSGKFLVRVSPELHRDIAQAARRQEKSLNAFVEEVLRLAAPADIVKQLTLGKTQTYKLVKPKGAKARAQKAKQPAE